MDIEKKLIKEYRDQLKKKIDDIDEPKKILPTEDQWCDISVPLQFMDQAFDIESDLRAQGITFDTGAGFGYRDWQLDFSLSGATAKEVVDYVRENYPRFYEIASISAYDKYELPEFE